MRLLPRVKLSDLIIKARFATGRRDAERLIGQGAVRFGWCLNGPHEVIEGFPITNIYHAFTPEALYWKDGKFAKFSQIELLLVGKRRMALVHNILYPQSPLCIPSNRWYWT